MGVNMSATTDKNKELKKVQQRLWAILGLKMAIDRLKELGYDVVASVTPENVATITFTSSTLLIDFDSGRVNGRDIVATLDELAKLLKEGKDEK